MQSPTEWATSAATRTLGPVDADFAAVATGTLILLLGLTWLLLCVGALWFESYRDFLATRVLAPAEIKSLLLWAPMLLAILIASSIGSTLMVALHGWHRLTSAVRTNAGWLWFTILLGLFAAALISKFVHTPVTIAWLAPLAMCVAALLSVCRRATAPDAAAEPPSRAVSQVDERLALIIAALAGAVTAFAWGNALGGISGTDSRVNTCGVVATVASACGLVVARMILRARSAGELGPLALLLAVIALLTPYHRLLAAHVDYSLVRLAWVAACSVICSALVGRRIGLASSSVQHTLALVGAYCAGGFGAATAAIAIAPPVSHLWMVSIITAGVSVLTAAVTLAHRRSAQPQIRVVGALLVAVIAASCFWFRQDVQAGLSPPRDSETVVGASAGVRDMQALFAAANMHVAIAVDERAGRPVSPLAFDDLNAMQVDVVIVASCPDRTLSSSPNLERSRRRLHRYARSLSPGGRLILELPIAPDIAEVLRIDDRATLGPDAEMVNLAVSGVARRFEALAIGRDIDAMVKRLPLPDDLEITVVPYTAR